MDLFKSIDAFLEDSLFPYFQDWVFLSCIIAIQVVTLYLLFRIAFGGRPIRLFDTRVGNVNVTSRALAELVHDACNHVGYIHKPRVEFRVKRSRLHLRVKIKLEHGKKLSDITSILHSQLTNTLQETLSYEKLGAIDIVVTGFTKKPKEDDSSALLIPQSENENSTEETFESEPEESYTTINQPSALTTPVAEEKIETPGMISSTSEEETDSEESATEAEETTPPKKRSFFGFGRKAKEDETEEEPLGFDTKSNELDLDFDASPQKEEEKTKE